MKNSKLSKLSLALICSCLLLSNRIVSADTDKSEFDKVTEENKVSDVSNIYASEDELTFTESLSTENLNSAELFSTDKLDTNRLKQTADVQENINSKLVSEKKVNDLEEDFVEAELTSDFNVLQDTMDSQTSVGEESADWSQSEDQTVDEQVKSNEVESNKGVNVSASSELGEEAKVSNDQDPEIDKSDVLDSAEEVQNLDENVVSASSLGLHEGKRRRREAGGWTNIAGAVYYIDPSTGLKLNDGVHFINSVPYLFNDKGQLIKGFYTNSKGERSFAKDSGVAYKLGVYTLSDGLNYVVDERAVIAKDKWIEAPGYGRAYGRPSDGVAYRNGAFTVKDGIRYVFNNSGYLAINEWVDEPGYGRAYGRPGDGAAYRGGAFTVSDGVRYVFNKGGYLAKGYWVDELGYGRAYGRPSDGAAYRGGAFTVSDGIRYVFNNGGYLAKGYWVDEKGYGKTYGDKKTGAAYMNGIYTVNDGLDYVFDKYGYLVSGRWVHFPNKGYAYAMPKTGQACKNGVHLVENKRHIFNEKGYAVEGWFFVDDKGFCFGLGQKGELVVNKKIKMNNRIYHMDSNGFWSDRKQLSANQLNNIEYQEKDNKLYLLVNGNKLDTPASINGKMIFVKPGTYELASPVGWHWFGDKEFYFTDKVSIAKPYQKVGNAYVNGAYGPRIYAEAKGIDVSSHNGDINWHKVKNDDVDFAFIRASYTTNTDFKFDKNMNGAKQAGIKTGIYIYSMAMNKQDAIKEADYIINLMKKYKINLPVAFDIEDPQVLNKTASNRARTDIIHAFAEKVQKAGYKVAVYSNLNWLNNYLIKEELASRYDIWLAHWHSKPGLNSKYWQASETGKVEGINTNVDIDFSFSKLP